MTPSDPAADRGEARPDLSYEEAREELVEVVRTLESGGGTLEESLALWERGEELAKICQSWLDGARRRLDAAMAQRPGTGPGSEPDEDRGAGDE
jgi:exodeoxyribonuclease VII small subunit